MSDEQPRKLVIDVFSQFESSGRPRDLSSEAQEPRAYGVHEVRQDLSPFAMGGPCRRDTAHIIYPVTQSTDSGGGSPRESSVESSEHQVVAAFKNLRDSMRLPFFRNSAESPRPLRSKCQELFNRIRQRGIMEEWTRSMDSARCALEEKVDGEWVVIEPVVVDGGDGDDEFMRIEMEAADLAPRPGFSLNISAHEVRRGRKIGEGAFGQVFRAIYRNRLVVMKQVASYHYDSSDGERFIRSLKTELGVLGALGRHPNVLECYGGSIKSPDVFMLCELRDMSLADLLHGQPGGSAPLPVELALHITHDILSGLAHLHSMSPKVVHRDVKPENILLNKRKHACVADFGLSKTKSHTYINTDNTHAGTPEYLAPEAATGKLNEKMDIYSVGVILWECLTAQRPWAEYPHPFAIFLTVANGQRLPLCESIFPTTSQSQCPYRIHHHSIGYPGGCSVMHSVRKIIEQCWRSEPHERPSCTELIDQIEDILLEMYHHGQ